MVAQSSARPPDPPSRGEDPMNEIVPSDAVPDLDPGITVLQSPDRRTAALYQLVCAELLERDGLVYWIDARNTASTYLLSEAAPHPRLLRSLRIARAFTAYQHHALIRRLVRTVSRGTELVVAPNIADLYRDDDIPEPEDQTYLTASLRMLREIGAVLDIPILLTTVKSDTLGALATDQASQEIQVAETQFGYHYSSADFTTRLYWDDQSWQTTIPYWVDLLGTRGESIADRAYEVGLIDAEV